MSEKENDLLRRFRAARRAAVAQVVIETPDQNATMGRLTAASNAIANGGPVAPVVQWDLIRGVRPRNDAGAAMLDAMGYPAPDYGRTINTPTDFLTFLVRGGKDGDDDSPPTGVFPKTIAFMLNVHRFLDAADVAQAFGNLSDPFKSTSRMVVGLAPSISIPAQLQQNVLVLDEPLPDAAELAQIVLDSYADVVDAEGKPLLEPPTPERLSQCVAALRGLAACSAEESCAMSMTGDGIDLDDLKVRSQKQIEALQGLSIWRDKSDTLDKLGGLYNSKQFFTRLFDSGNGRPEVIVFLDEVEQSTPSQNGAPSGNVEKDAMGTLLSHMENTKATGSMLVGVPGAGKSQLVKALGNYAGVDVLCFDIPGMKGGIMGDSERNLRAAVRVVESYGKGKALWIATSNDISQLPPQFRSRFKLPTFFFDFPDAEERAAIWPVYLKEFDLPEQELPVDKSWTGREIRACCENAWRLKCSLLEASEYVVPIATAAKAMIAQLRSEATGCYIDATRKGFYTPKRGAIEGERVKRQVDPNQPY